MIQGNTCIGIMAADPNGVVGTGQGLLPWNIPEEVSHFRKTTRGQPLIMGRKTFDELTTNQLLGRPIGVFSHQSVMRHDLDVTTLHTLNDWLTLQPTWPCTYMIGGADIANLFLQHQALNGFILTRIHANYAGTARLNMTFFDGWKTMREEVYNDYTIQYIIPPQAKGTFDDIFI